MPRIKSGSGSGSRSRGDVRGAPRKKVNPDYSRAGEHFVVKAQRSIMTNEDGTPDGMMLIYDQRRQYEFQFPITAPWKRAMGSDLKRFFAVRLESDNASGKHKYKMAILSRVIDRN